MSLPIVEYHHCCPPPTSSLACPRPATGPHVDQVAELIGDCDRCRGATFEGEIDATGIWTGQTQTRCAPAERRLPRRREPPQEDRVQRPFTERTGGTTVEGSFELTIRGVRRALPLGIISLGEWKTPFWIGDKNKGDMRIGFDARASINCDGFAVSWHDEISGGGWSSGTKSNWCSTSKQFC
jgi:hypothetical protein